MPNLPERLQDFVRSILDYDPETGVFHWRERTPDMFKDSRCSAKGGCARWNAQFAGKVAGILDTNGYRKIRVDNRHLGGEHVIAWLWVHGEYLPGGIDHINRVRDDNRLVNLRKATKSQQQVNRTPKANKAGALGVYFEPSRKTWKVSVRNNGKLVWGGRHKSFEAAVAARDKLTSKINPDFRPSDL
jgi:hypothetical protein